MNPNCLQLQVPVICSWKVISLNFNWKSLLFKGITQNKLLTVTYFFSYTLIELRSCWVRVEMDLMGVLQWQDNCCELGLNFSGREGKGWFNLENNSHFLGKLVSKKERVGLLQRFLWHRTKKERKNTTIFFLYLIARGSWIFHCHGWKCQGQIKNVTFVLASSSVSMVYPSVSKEKRLKGIIVFQNNTTL